MFDELSERAEKKFALVTKALKQNATQIMMNPTKHTYRREIKQRIKKQQQQIQMALSQTTKVIGNSSNHSLIKRPCGSNNKSAAEEYILPDLEIMEAEISQICNTASKLSCY